MKTIVNQINSSIIVPARAAAPSENAVSEQPLADRAPRAHIITRRAARWARRSTH